MINIYHIFLGKLKFEKFSWKDNNYAVYRDTDTNSTMSNTSNMNNTMNNTNNTIKNFCYFNYTFYLEGANYDGYDSDPGPESHVELRNEGFGKYTFVGYSIPEDYLERIRLEVYHHILEKHRCRRLGRLIINITNIRPNGTFLMGDEEKNLDFEYAEKPDIEKYMSKSYKPVNTTEIKGKNSGVHVNNADIEEIADVREDEYVENHHRYHNRPRSHFHKCVGRIVRGANSNDRN